MANTYAQMYAHIVFAVKNREALIAKSWKNDLEKYITGIVQNNKHKMLAVGAVRDHIHIFIGYNVNQTIPSLVEQIKTSSNAWINANQLTTKKFEWQKGYGVFSHARSNISTVIRYVENQEEHHRQKTFSSEYQCLLIDNEVEFKKEYLFDFFEDE